MQRLNPVSYEDPAARRNTVSAKALVELREAILTTRVKPGEGLSETGCATALGISRTPVREAFARLFEEGLIEIASPKGTCVSLIDMNRVREAIFVRSTLESAVVAAATDVPSDEVLDELEMFIWQQERAAEKQDMNGLHQADMRFHSALMRVFGMPTAWTALQHVTADMIRVQFLVGLRPDHVEHILREHRAILASLRKGAFSEAAALLKDHISNVNYDQDALQAGHGEYFRREGRL